MNGTGKNHLDNGNKVIVFLHYFGGSAQSWNWVIENLEDEYHCISIDIPGFGNSDSILNPTLKTLAAAIIKQLEALKLSNYILVGHSMGAKIAMQIALKDQNVEGLILICPSPPGIEPMEGGEKIRMLNHPNLTEAKTTVNNISKLPLSREQYNLAIENNMNADCEIWKWWLNQGVNHSLKIEVEQIKIPIHIVTSVDDPVITPEIINERLLTVFPDAQLISTAGCGHLIPMEKPKWIAQQIRQCLKN